jgi:hypothetical protein
MCPHIPHTLPFIPTYLPNLSAGLLANLPLGTGTGTGTARSLEV